MGKLKQKGKELDKFIGIFATNLLTLLSALSYNKYRIGNAMDGLKESGTRFASQVYCGKLAERRKYEADVCNGDAENDGSHFPF